MYKVQLCGQPVLAEEGQILSQLLHQEGHPVEMPCGGQGKCQKCTVLVDGKPELACRYRVTRDIRVELPETGEILSETGVREVQVQSGETCLVLDIGTTTLAMAQVDLQSGGVLQVQTRTNPQRAYGADVMSRIDRCAKYGPEEQQEAVLDRIREMLTQMGDVSGKTLYVAGNATMLHLFFGVDCTSMGKAPYRPAFLETRSVPATELGLENLDRVVSLPSVSAFVGADVVAGMYYTDFPPEGKYNLLVDLGTNAEVVLFSKDKVLCTAAAAGPCFEGANISCGMSATPGAISAFAPGNTYETIGNVPAKGICGTGLVDLVATLLAEEVIDETGFMEEDYVITDAVQLTQGDVRQFQLAKSAVHAAMLTLMEMENADFSQIHKLYISGGFSARINVENAVKTGLLPEALQDRCTPIRNSSLLGTVKYACQKDDLSPYVAPAQYVDLSANPTFTDLFVEKMLFEE